MAISKTYTLLTKGQIYFMQTALLLAVGLSLWVMFVLIFFQNWLLPATGCAVVAPQAWCATVDRATQIAPDDSVQIEGHTLFEANCISCHAMSADVVVGPGLKGIEERRDSVWIVRFIRNSQEVIQSGDKYAVDLFEKYNKAIMPKFDFTDAEMKAIMRYIRLANRPMY